jgi:hypothetical protein
MYKFIFTHEKYTSLFLRIFFASHIGVHTLIHAFFALYVAATIISPHTHTYLFLSFGLFKISQLAKKLSQSI